MTSKKEIVFERKAAIGGAYLDPHFYQAYWELVEALHELIPDDRSFGALGLQGVASMCRARTKAIVDKAKIMENIMKAVTAGRK
jgi:uncharacterized protein involved in copper resistance